MRIYEITLEGFSGDTDETDHFVIWIASRQKPVIVGRRGSVKSVSLLPPAFNENTPGVDLIIGGIS